MQLINNLFEIEWLTLGEDVKKDLLTITRCGTVPIEFTSAYIFPMNLDSFVGVSIINLVLWCNNAPYDITITIDYCV